MLFPLPVFIDSVKFLFLNKSRAFAAAIARAEAFGPAEDTVDDDVLNKLLKSVRIGSDCCSMECWIEWTVCGWFPIPVRLVARKCLICADISFFDDVGGVGDLRLRS